MDQRQHHATPGRGLETQPTVPQGPTELDPSLFALVSGGTPRTGWAAAVAVCDATQSPKTGWQ